MEYESLCNKMSVIYSIVYNDYKSVVYCFYCLCGVMVSVLASSVKGHRFYPRPAQTKT